MKCWLGKSVEIIIGASVCPKSCAMTGPIRDSASSSLATHIGAAPYQKHCSEDPSMLAMNWPTSGARMITISPPRARTGKQSTPGCDVSGGGGLGGVRLD